MVYVSISKTSSQAFKGFVIVGEADHENRTGPSIWASNSPKLRKSRSKINPHSVDSGGI